MKMFLTGDWEDRPQEFEILSPYDGRVLDTAPLGTAADMDAAVAGAVSGAAEMRRTTGHARHEMLARAAELLLERSDAFAHTISLEAGKTLAEARGEVARAHQTLQLSAEEAKRLTGEVLPLDGAPGGAGKLGYTLRVPCGVVAAITPFNFPLNLVCHKVAPALAAGNAVVIKPASDTPLSALSLVELLLEAGIPPLALACVTGPGAELGGALAADRRVRKLSFTGSRDVGEKLCQVAGLKRITMELGSNSPMIVMQDANLADVARAIVTTGYGNAGQTCISTQRVIAVGDSHDALAELLQEHVAAIRAGDPLDENSDMGPMIRAADAQRVESWVAEAAGQGARVVVGGGRQGGLMQPTVILDAQPSMRVCREELFGPAVAVLRASTLDQALDMANHSQYGLSAAIFTESLRTAMRFAREMESGNIHINGGPGWRADLMPYGGLKESGFGKEGPRYAIESMTELKTVVIHGLGH